MALVRRQDAVYRGSDAHHSIEYADPRTPSRPLTDQWHWRTCLNAINVVSRSEVFDGAMDGPVFSLQASANLLWMFSGRRQPPEARRKFHLSIDRVRGIMEALNV
jgi:hypothetical protein